MLRGAIASFATGTYTFTRRAPSTRVDGRSVLGAPTAFDAVACVQPASGKTLFSLPEAFRVGASWVIYCTTALRVDDRFVDDDGVTCRITHVMDWRAWGEIHFVAAAAKEKAS